MPRIATQKKVWWLVLFASFSIDINLLHSKKRFEFEYLLFHLSIRSHKEKRSSYAPEKGLRYDGIYRIEKCWTKVGIQVISAVLDFGWG